MSICILLEVGKKFHVILCVLCLKLNTEIILFPLDVTTFCKNFHPCSSLEVAVHIGNELDSTGKNLVVPTCDQHSYKSLQKESLLLKTIHPLF